MISSMVGLSRRSLMAGRTTIEGQNTGTAEMPTSTGRSRECLGRALS